MPRGFSVGPGQPLPGRPAAGPSIPTALPAGSLLPAARSLGISAAKCFLAPCAAVLAAGKRHLAGLAAVLFTSRRLAAPLAALLSVGCRLLPEPAPGFSPGGRWLAARTLGQTALAGALCLAGLTALSGPVLAAGMDCAKAKTPVELRICADPALVEADRGVAEAFAAALAAAPDPATVRASQRQWLATRNACADDACLRSSHAERRTALLALAAGAAPAPRSAAADMPTGVAKDAEAALSAGAGAPAAARQGPASNAPGTPASGKSAAALAAPASAASPGADRKTFMAERAALKARLGWPADCESSFQETYAPDGAGLELLDSGVDRYDLGQGRALYLIQCDQAAYQSVYVAMATIAGDGPARLLRFPTADADGGRITRSAQESLVGNPVFDAAAKTLTNLTKARGVGDCGTYAVYAFAANGDPRPLEIRARDCPKTGGKFLPPERWPLVKMP